MSYVCASLHFTLSYPFSTIRNLYLRVDHMFSGLNGRSSDRASAPFGMGAETTDMAMGWVDPWVELGWVGSSSVKYELLPNSTGNRGVARNLIWVGVNVN